MTSPAKKTLLIILVTFIALIIILPPQVVIGGKTFERRSLQIGNAKIDTNFPLVLGLDLAGGSRLVFEIDTTQVSGTQKERAIKTLKEVLERRVNLFGVSEPNIQTSSFEGKDRILVELPGIRDTKEAISLLGETAKLSFAEIKEGEEESLPYKETDLGGSDLKSAQIVFDQTNGRPVVQIQFTESGEKKFAEITERNVGKPLPILLDGQIVTSPIVEEKITGGMAIIRGEFTSSSADKLAIQLNAGALPLAIKLVEERTVGASLGQDSIQKAISAGIIGMAMVALFMILSYRFMGFIAVCALIIFGIITLAIYKLIPVVLTLPGIAGFLLSVGMAVDSNILIFERFKEEIKKRKSEDALEVSFGQAWDAIRDANIATLTVAFMLANPLELSFLHTSGPVRGFAITLALGILISMFTGIVVSRNLLRMFVKNRTNNKEQSA